MLSIGKLGSGAERYYLGVVAAGREEYYTGAGESPGRWLGSGSAELGLAGDVDPAALRAVLDGRSPADGGPLVATWPGRARVAGFDLTFSAPKSVSVLYGLGGADTSAEVRAAHVAAVDEALSYLQAHATLARRGSGGERHIGTGGLVAAGFVHRTSRSGDPQLHTHVLVANLVRGVDGRWSAPDARLLYRHGRTAGFVYQAALRAELARRLGVSFDTVRQGVAEVAGVDPALLRAFATRRAEIEARLEQQGATSARAAQTAALATRPAKVRPTDVPAEDRPGSLADTWRARAAELGLDVEHLGRLAGPHRTPAVPEEVSVAGELLGPDGLTAQRSTFARRDVVRAVAEACGDGAPLAVLDRLVDGVVRSPEVVRFDRRDGAAEQVLTTAGLLQVEEALLERAAAGRGRGAGVVGADVLDRVVETAVGVDGDQVAVVRGLASAGDQVAVVVGRAGAGKTTTLALARQAWEAAGLRVRGAALSARAATELERSAGIASTTLARLQGALDTDSVVFDRRDVVVVDEAGMVGTRQLAHVVEAASDAGAKVVLVGDPRQLPEIAAGGAFAELVRRGRPLELGGNHRQRSPWERAALDELRAGDVAVALHAYDAAGRIHHFDAADDARRALVADWLAAHGAEPQAELRMLAARRADVDRLNRLARSALRAGGRLGGDVLAGPQGEGFAVGDQVVLLRNDRRLGVTNGQRATVVGAAGPALVGAAGPALVVDAGGQHRTIDGDYLAAGHLAHGYATTVHKSQGETVDRAFVLGGEALFREAGYVAMSRARHRSDLYVVGGAFETGIDPHGNQPLHDEPAPRQTPPASGPRHPAAPSTDAGLQALQHGLTTSHAKEMALTHRRPHPQPARQPRVPAQRREPAQRAPAAPMGRTQAAEVIGRWRRAIGAVLGRRSGRTLDAGGGRQYDQRVPGGAFHHPSDVLPRNDPPWRYRSDRGLRR